MWTAKETYLCFHCCDALNVTEKTEQGGISGFLCETEPQVPHRLPLLYVGTAWHSVTLPAVSEVTGHSLRDLPPHLRHRFLI